MSFACPHVFFGFLPHPFKVGVELDEPAIPFGILNVEATVMVAF